jgi:hypothetical protein
MVRSTDRHSSLSRYADRDVRALSDISALTLEFELSPVCHYGRLSLHARTGTEHAWRKNEARALDDPDLALHLPVEV